MTELSFFPLVHIRLKDALQELHISLMSLLHPAFHGFTLLREEWQL